MNPIQPFFALSTDHYYKKIIYGHGISHIYCFTCDEPVSGLPSVLPDGCLDITFDLTADRPLASVCGSVTSSEMSHSINQTGHTYLGIRFEPGYVPSFIDGQPSDFVDREVPLDACCSDPYLTEKVLCAREQDLRSGEGRLAQLILKEGRAFDAQASGHTLWSSSDSHLALCSFVLHLITQTSGMIQIGKIEEETGYSRRYIGEVFHAATGFSPKKMCEIIRFQSALEELTHNREVSIAEVAVKYGYYDQPQFSRDIRRYLHTTPRSYRSALQSAHYLERFVLV